MPPTTGTMPEMVILVSLTAVASALPLTTPVMAMYAENTDRMPFSPQVITFLKKSRIRPSIPLPMAAEPRERARKRYSRGASNLEIRLDKTLSNSAVPKYKAEAVTLPPEATREADMTGSSSFPKSLIAWMVSSPCRINTSV